MDNFKFSHLKTFGSNEALYGGAKKYRAVYDASEARYIYAELAFYNKLFDEEEWTANARFVCTDVATNTQVCELKKVYTVTKDINIFYAREGWGTPNPGWWKQGKYRWDVYIEEKLVGSAHFYITNQGLVTETTNPYIAVKSVRLFESSIDGTALGERQYLKTFAQSKTRYINIEMTVDILPTERPLPLEFQFNYYNDAGQHKAYVEYFWELTDDRKSIVFDTGYGSNNVGYWSEDKFSLEVIFMDQLIGVVAFTVGATDEVQEGSMAFGSYSRGAVTSGGNTVTTEVKKPTFEEASTELQKLIGLDSVKRQLEEFSTYLQFLNIRKSKGFEETGKFNMHTVFMGNPGTGKTTVAKMLGQIYYSLDLLSKGHVYEVGRTELVGEYIGQTAPKVQKAIEKARGGILFVDEAYALSNRGDDGKDFGKEVIEVLLKEMSDGAGDIAIVFAGYPKEMGMFLASNPGLSSRIQSQIMFPDYTPDELMLISDYCAEKRSIVITPEAKEFIHRKVVEYYRNRDQHFGNARFINGIIEECKENMALRLMKLGKAEIEKMDKDQLSTVTLEDAEKAFGVSNVANVHIPVDELLLKEALVELHNLVGLDEVKRDVDEMAKLVRYYTEIGRDVKKAFSLHTVFTGNPGTGKTTLARIIVKIYKALGVLERGHLVEVDRKNLVAGYLGQTAIKTGEMIEAAKGGGLFIDEAYAISDGSDFGKEAINTLLKAMEDRRGEFVVIVAGYVDEMRTFLESNPGLMSRFDRTLFFPDYNDTQLFDIGVEMLETDQLVLDESAAQAMKTYIQGLLERKHKYFGNARTIRKIVKEVARRQNLRLATMTAAQRTPEMIRTVTADDFKDIKLMEQSEENKRKGIGFNN